MSQAGYYEITIQRAIARTFLFTMMLFTLTASVVAQSLEDSREEERGMVFYEKFQGSSNTLGQVLKMDTTAGYNFNKHFGVDAGVPFYFVRSSPNSQTLGSTSNNGIGNAYVDLRLTVTNPAINFASTLTGTAPTGDTDTGFSTGRATFDWNNYFDHTFSQITPFANLGVANTVSDTHFFTRPFTSLGLVSHFEGGANFKISRSLGLGAAAYAVLPSGQQKIYSKLIKQQAQNPGTESAVPGSRDHKGAFESAHVTIGGADLARDNGYSAWFDINPARYLDLELGYNRSVHYALNTFSFTVGFNLRYLAQKGGSSHP
ncbi:MAG: hypothetical protein DMG06_00190 [Acidobacteria bacterium]|nr:MAG: hypothetical protein DMG06_00190 [Acidobacteriota bacterium]